MDWKRPAVLLALVSLLVAAPAWSPAWSDEVELADGRVLQGRFALLPGVAIAPEAEGSTKPSGGTSILVCDDELTRTMVAKRRVVRTAPGQGDAGGERIRIPQRIPESGRRVVGVGQILGATPFDEYGRRILSLNTAGGRLDIVQGITQIAARWTSVEGILTERPNLLDMRIATSSIPRDVLKRVIDQHLDRKNPDDRLRVVRLFLQAERYDDARQELDEVLRDFPDLAELAQQRKDLASLAAAKLLDEVLIRGRVGSDLSLEEGYAAARQVGLAMLATLRTELGSLDRIKRVVKLLGLVNSAPDFYDHPKVINGCSELFAAVFGEEFGIGARSAFGTGPLPGNIAAEIEGVFELA